MAPRDVTEPGSRIAIFSSLAELINLGERRREAVAQIRYPNHSKCLFPSGKLEHQGADRIRMTDHFYQVHSARAVRTGEPILDRPFTGAGPIHDCFDGLV